MKFAYFICSNTGGTGNYRGWKDKPYTLKANNTQLLKQVKSVDSCNLMKPSLKALTDNNMITNCELRIETTTFMVLPTVTYTSYTQLYITNNRGY